MIVGLLKIVLQVGRLDDLMVCHQSFVAKEPENVGTCIQ